MKQEEAKKQNNDSQRCKNGGKQDLTTATDMLVGHISTYIRPEEWESNDLRPRLVLPHTHPRPLVRPIAAHERIRDRRPGHTCAAVVPAGDLLSYMKQLAPQRNVDT